MARTKRAVPLSYDDDFRGAFTYMFIPLAAVVLGIVSWRGGRAAIDLATLVTLLCGISALGSLGYIVWTHLLFTGTPHEAAERIAAAQYRGHGPGWIAQLLGFTQRSASSTSLSSAGLTIIVAIAATVIGAEGRSVWLPLMVLVTAATSWATMVYSYALHYFRLHSAGERITFDIDEEPRFQDFLSMSVMVSSVGAMSAGTPRTRKGLTAVRTHTYIAFIFNALVVAMTVSILGTLVAGIG